MRKTKKVTCACGKEFDAKKKTQYTWQKYCSAKCSRKYSSWRKFDVKKA